MLLAITGFSVNCLVWIFCLKYLNMDYNLWGNVAGERSKDKEDLLQEQGVQEAHLAQGYTIQDRQG